MSNPIETLDRMTVQGELVQPLEGGAVRCLACAHRCLIRPGRRGICQVRYNDDGLLKVPWGYVAALQADPIEKKPFFHLLPGQDALTFGMLGCDFHCGYCFAGETMVVTDQGPMSLADAFALSERIDHQPDGEIGYPSGLKAVTAGGRYRHIRAVFKHPYQGEVVSILPYYLPEFRCTPDHRLYATEDPQKSPCLLRASEITNQHYLAIPRCELPAETQVIRPADLLSQYRIRYHVRWSLSPEDREITRTATEQGQTSRQIGLTLAKSASYIRHVRSKLARGAALDARTSGPLLEDGMLRYPNEHRPGIPLQIPLDEDMARLLGYYCAEGCVVQSKKRPNSLVTNFSFSPEETAQAQEVVELLQKCLGVRGRLVFRPTTLAVSVTKASAALLFKVLAGNGAQAKRVPEGLFASPKPVIRAFLDAFVAGDGHVYENGKVSSTTVSRNLAYGLGWLAFMVGYLPSIYDAEMPEEARIRNRQVKRAAHQYSVVWYEKPPRRSKCIRTGSHFLIPIRRIARQPYDGDVYNMEVGEEHNYLANFFLVSNCQNWLTSQTGRDPASNVSLEYVQRVTPREMVAYARRTGAGVVASSYNEPLITSEWAVSIFQEALKDGLRCVYISNGNATPEALDYLRPYIVGYKVDLKTMQDRQYRQLGGVLKNVLETIALAWERGLWVEVVTLVIPGFNDSTGELMQAARYIASVSPEIPWHVTAFHPDYKMTGPDATQVDTLTRAVEIGQEAGLQFVYAGNLPGRVGTLENTFCPNCGKLLIERHGFVLLDYQITGQGTCPACGHRIPGLWPDRPETVRLGGPGWPRRIMR